MRLSFVRVEKGQDTSQAKLRAGVEEVSDFLVAHAAGLSERAAKGTAATASFRSPEDAQTLQQLQTGTDAEFLVAADRLSARLLEEMKRVGSPAPGLLVCTTFESDSDERSAAVLKLEVVAEQGAVLRQLDNGEETLAAVTDVLDRPGDLQKGVVYPDARADSDAIVGDKLAQREARYFLQAVGITLEEKASRSGVALIKAVSSRLGAETAQRVAARLPTIDSGTPAAVLQTLAGEDVVPTEAVAQVVDDLRRVDRPVTTVDTSAPVNGRVTAGELVITGPSEAMAAVTWTPDADGGWIVRFRSATEPRRSWT